MRNIAVYIEGQRLDLFDNEGIELNRSVQDIKDISKIYTDFTQSFTVPASKNNNKIFQHFERPEIDNGYDTRIKKDASITINSLDFLKGKIRLESVAVKGNNASSFKITFFGNLVSLKDLIGEDKLQDLEWLSQFDHAYDWANIQAGLTDAIEFTVNGNVEKVIKYPLISPVRRWFYDSGADTTDLENIVNIAYKTGTQTHGINSYEFKPALSIYWIVKAIEEKYGISFSGNFFERDEFKEVYMWLSRDKGYMRSSGNYLIPFEDSNVVQDNKLVFTLQPNNPQDSNVTENVNYNLTITPIGSENYDVILTNNGEPYREVKGLSGEQSITGSFSNNSNTDPKEIEVGFYINSESGVVFDADLTVVVSYSSSYGGSGTTYNHSLINQTLNSSVVITEQVPDMKVADFLEGLFKKYNLTLIPSDDQIEVNSLEEWYANGKIIDISKHVNKDSLTIEKGTILRQINLQFKEGESFLMEEFRKNFGRGYGDINFILRDSEGRRLDGEELDIELPFEQLIYERLTDVNTAALTEVQYGYVTDEKQEPYKIDAHLFYNYSRELTSTIAVKDADDTIYEISTVNCPSHIGALNLSSFSTTFSADYEEYTGNVIADNLLTNYYLDYLTDLFSIKRRVFNYTANLPSSLLQKIKLNDRLIVDGRRFIINTLKVNLVTKEADLELINDIYRGETQDSLTNKMLLSQYYAEYPNTNKGGSFSYTTNENQNYLISYDPEDIGYGTDWIINLTHAGNRISFTVGANATGEDRYVVLKLVARQSTTYYKIMQHA